MEIESQLARTTIFIGLDQETRSAIAALGRPRELQPGDILVEEEQPNSSLFVLFQGRLDIYLPESPARPRRIPLRTCHAGEVVGEYSAFDRQLTSARVQAVVPCQLFEIDAEALEAWMERSPVAASRIYRNLIVALVRRLRDKDAELDLMASF